MLTVIALVLVELLSPFGRNVFDANDIIAGVGGTALAVLAFRMLLRTRLTFGN